MRYSIEHRMRYDYTGFVFLMPHAARLKPRRDAAQRLESFELSFSPEPDGRTACTDPEGHESERVWFSGTTTAFEAHARSVVRTLRANPFDYLLDHDASEIPVRYSPEERRVLAPCLEPDPSAEVRQFARELAGESDHHTTDFLDALNRNLAARFNYVVRVDGPPLAPARTLDLKEVTCRDASLLFMAACRAMGVAARFVSGYHEGDPENPAADLHAWAEVYLPGAGWRGYDPSVGLAVADRHVVLCASADPALCVPLDGTFRGTGVAARFAYSVSITVL